MNETIGFRTSSDLKNKISRAVNENVEYRSISHFMEIAAKEKLERLEKEKAVVTA